METVENIDGRCFLNQPHPIAVSDCAEFSIFAKRRAHSEEAEKDD